jgi:hypothetical protein
LSAVEKYKDEQVYFGLGLRSRALPDGKRGAREDISSISGNQRRLRRFTLHSMRDRFGVTAAEEWEYTDTELLQQGSWSDLSTVRKLYMGFTDITQLSVQKKHQQSLVKE